MLLLRTKQMMTSVISNGMHLLEHTLFM